MDSYQLKNAKKILHQFNQTNKRQFRLTDDVERNMLACVNLSDSFDVSCCCTYITTHPTSASIHTLLYDYKRNTEDDTEEDIPSIPKEAPKQPPTPTSTSTDSGDVLGALLNPIITKLSEEQSTKIRAEIKDMLDKYDTELSKKLAVIPTRIQLECEELDIPKDELYHKEFEHCLQYAKNHVNIMLTGESGTGKTHLCTQLAKVLKLDFYSANAVTDPYVLSGYKDVNGNFVETDFYKAYTRGGLFLLDEMDGSSAEALITLNTAIDNGFMAFANGVKQMHKDFTLVATANTFGEGADYKYVGRNQLDSATLNRFAVIKINYDPNIELAVCGNNIELCEFAREFRRACNKTNTLCITSYRAIKNIAKFESIQDLDYVIQVNLTKSLSPSEITKIMNEMSLSNNKYFTACKRLAS